MTSRVVVIVPTYNGLRYLVPCLESLRRQTYRDFFVLVMDDGSDDGTADVLRALFPEVALVRFAKNRGLARAQNAAIATTCTEFVALLNNDTEAAPDWLDHLVRAADARLDAWAVAGKLRLFDRRSALHAAGDSFGVDGVPRNIGVWETDDGRWDDGRAIWGPQGGAALYRRSALDALSDERCGTPFDESFFMYCEDVDLNWRARLRGFDTAFAPEAIVYHHVSATAGGALASYYVGRNMLAVLVKDMPGALLRNHWRRILRAQWGYCVESLRHGREPAARARLRGQFATVRMLPDLLRARRCLLSRRAVPVDNRDLERRLFAPPAGYATIDDHAGHATGGGENGEDVTTDAAGR